MTIMTEDRKILIDAKHLPIPIR